MLFQELGKLKRSMIMTSVIMMAVGILMLICPERYVGLLVAAAGYGLLIFATIKVLEFLSSKKVLINYVYLTGALLVGILGVATLFYRNNVLQVLGLLFGIFLLLEGINELFNTWRYARRAQRSGWWFLVGSLDEGRGAASGDRSDDAVLLCGRHHPCHPDMAV